jgi:hypothetical protein
MIEAHVFSLLSNGVRKWQLIVAIPVNSILELPEFLQVLTTPPTTMWMSTESEALSLCPPPLRDHLIRQYSHTPAHQ